MLAGLGRMWSDRMARTPRKAFGCWSGSIRPSLCVLLDEVIPEGLPEPFRNYVTRYPMGKQLGLIMTLPREHEPVLYADSDILFFAARTIC